MKQNSAHYTQHNNLTITNFEMFFDNDDETFLFFSRCRKHTYNQTFVWMMQAMLREKKRKKNDLIFQKNESWLFKFRIRNFILWKIWMESHWLFTIWFYLCVNNVGRKSVCRLNRVIWQTMGSGRCGWSLPRFGRSHYQ